MNFIKVGKLFVNLREVESFEVYATPNDVAVSFMYRSGRHELTHIAIESDDSSCVFDVETAENLVADAIYDMIQNCADADCENIEDYLEG